MNHSTLHAKPTVSGSVRSRQAKQPLPPPWVGSPAPDQEDAAVGERPSVEVAAEVWSEKGVRLAQKTQVGPCIRVGIQW